MTYVITEPCIGEKNGACVDVCPAACIHTTPEAQQNYIDPDVCIECEQCVLVCPVDAIFLDSEVPSEWQSYIEINAAFFRANKAAHHLSADEALRMVSAAQAYAMRAGSAVAVAVLNANGETLACSAMNGCDAVALEQATRKAYTSLVYQLPSHELRKGSPPPWIATDSIDATRVLMVSGGLPLVEGSCMLGAVGVAGASGADQDLLCCQAAVASQSNAH
jgi:ferredoxin